MSAYLLVIRDRNGKPVDMGIYSSTSLTLGVRHRAELAPRPYAETKAGNFSDAQALILARMLTDAEPWTDDLRPFVDQMLADFKPRDPYREPAPEPKLPTADPNTVVLWDDDGPNGKTARLEICVGGNSDYYATIVGEDWGGNPLRSDSFRACTSGAKFDIVTSCFALLYAIGKGRREHALSIAEGIVLSLKSNWTRLPRE